MITVLLWGDRWWLPHHRLPVPFAEPGQAADMLASAWRDPAKKIRLVYQPDDFATVAVDCPNANRATLAVALAEEHPVVFHPGHAWSHEPILGAHGSFNTLLHYETRPALFALVQQLQDHGFTVTSVWPMATWLNALPPELSDSGAMTICAIEPDRFCLYRHSGDGVRAVRAGRHGDVLTAVAAHLGGVAAKTETEFVLYVTTDDALVEKLNERIPISEAQVVGVLAVWEALAKQAVINPRHPAQLLPPVPRVSFPPFLTLLALGCLVAALGLAGIQGRDYLAARTGRAEIEAEKQTLRRELAPLQRNEAELLRLAAEKASLSPDPLAWAALLRAVPQGLPPSVVLTRLRADRQGFRLDGGVSAGLPEAEWRHWRDCLQGGEARWTLAGFESAPPTADFTVRGLWR